MIDSNNRELMVTHDNELAYILSKFNTDFIYVTVRESLNNTVQYFNNSMSNIVTAYETIFKQTLMEYPDASSEINQKREEVYLNILKIICDYYQFIYQDYDTYDLYTSTSYIYTVFVSQFQQYLLSFFVNFIIKEKNGLYESINIPNTEDKNKGIGIIYSKKIFKDYKLAAIISNLPEVIDNICAMDIPLNTYISISLASSHEEINTIMTDHLNAVLSTNIDFIKMYIAPLFKSSYNTVLYSSIKLILQQYAVETSSTNTNIIFNKIEEEKNE